MSGELKAMKITTRRNVGPLERREGLDLTMIDHYRTAAKADLARELAEALLKSGQVKITDRLRDDGYYGCAYVEITMELKVAA